MNPNHLLKLLQSKRDFSGLFYIVEDQQQIQHSQGVENHLFDTLISSKTAFGIASGTKFLTALAIGMLIDQNKCSLDTYVSDLLTEQEYTYDKTVQIKHLLSHTSGIPDYLDEELPLNEDIDNLKLLSITDYLQYFPQREKDFTPGTRFKYHNGAFVLLARIVDTISGFSYQDFINEKLLKPLGILHSGIFKSSEQRPYKAMGYLDLPNQVTNIGAIPEMPGGDGGAYMSAPDFYKLVRAFMEYCVLSQALTQEFLQPHVLVDQSKYLYYGYGLWLKKVDDFYLPYVIGVDAGIRFKAIFHPYKNNFYWIVTNTNDDIWDLLEMIEEIASSNI